MVVLDHNLGTVLAVGTLPCVQRAAVKLSFESLHQFNAHLSMILAVASEHVRLRVLAKLGILCSFALLFQRRSSPPVHAMNTCTGVSCLPSPRHFLTLLDLP